MKSIVMKSVLLVLLLALMGAALSAEPVEAQDEALCYAVADGESNSNTEDQLVSLNRVTGVTTDIGATGTFDVEAIAFDTDGQTLYAANEDQLGVLNLNTAEFTALPSPFGSGTGAAGPEDFDDIDGLAIDPATGDLYGSHRIRGENDLLIKINKSTGAHVPDAFGTDIDYVPISGSGVLPDIDDIAIDPVTGAMYAASNTGGSGGVLVTIDMTTGAATVVGNFSVDDIEGLAYFNDGQLYGSTGKEEATANQLYKINETTGAATDPVPFSQYVDYEALGCLTQPNSVGLVGIDASSTNGIAPTVGLLLGLTALAGFTTVVVWRRGGLFVER